MTGACAHPLITISSWCMPQVRKCLLADQLIYRSVHELLAVIVCTDLRGIPTRLALACGGSCIFGTCLRSFHAWSNTHVSRLMPYDQLLPMCCRAFVVTCRRQTGSIKRANPEKTCRRACTYCWHTSRLMHRRRAGERGPCDVSAAHDSQQAEGATSCGPHVRNMMSWTKEIPIDK